jgi:hypothetical protein
MGRRSGKVVGRRSGGVEGLRSGGGVGTMSGGDRNSAKGICFPHVVGERSGGSCRASNGRRSS